MVEISTNTVILNKKYFFVIGTQLMVFDPVFTIFIPGHFLFVLASELVQKTRQTEVQSWWEYEKLFSDVVESKLGWEIIKIFFKNLS
jgi:ABC-type uncharacterized transport system YnjBCD permease subunit